MSESASSLVRVEVSDGIAEIILDDPKRRNAMTPELGDAFSEAVARVQGDASVRAVVVSGAGEAFSAGGDLKMLQRLRAAQFDEARDFMRSFYARYLAVTELEVPTVAGVRGAAIGAGLCVALACDLCVVDANAKLALNFVQLGLHPGMGAMYLVPRRAGAQRAAELLLTGRRFDGREAVAMGLALDAVTPEEVNSRARSLAKQVAVNAPLAVRALKRELGVDREALERCLAQEAHHQAESYGSQDLDEGLAAAAERRPPVFKGR